MFFCKRERIFKTSFKSHLKLEIKNLALYCENEQQNKIFFFYYKIFKGSLIIINNFGLKIIHKQYVLILLNLIKAL